ncbi:M23 family metallopeptidase [Henriciella pelagia]|uniref:M23ase beta-sheet core domain-containing protein n=1 Tax=Henriciella pelagia TaxID=1977912 RepID=A0ABQ1JL42_9PROT|nr:M23 family metallopeptidase [Henriciella pelagia]GGB69803.1 hypothetical protein GCM10011503_18080 [Henriciella pelagia]
MKLLWGLAAGALLLVPACDKIRYPGDNRDDGYQADIPPGAPGPAPPSEPVEDPYNTGDTGPDTPVDTDPTDPADPSDPTGPATPDTEPATDPETDLGTDPETDPADPSEPGTDPVAPVDSDTDPETPDTDPVDPETDTDPEPVDPEPGPDIDPTPVDNPVEPEPTVVFSYVEAGHLLPGSGTGTIETEAIFAPGIRFPIKSAPAYLQSQVWMFGGGIAGGDQCDPRNYEYPWRDNFCETRSSNRNSPYCPVSKIHQGQDIRVGTAAGCNELRRTAAADRKLYEVVAVEDGIIQSIGTYTVTMRSGPRIYKYMHMNMRALQVSAGDTVTKGQTLGYVSNDFGGTPTTFHLHFELLQNTAEGAWVHVPPYTSLVAAYEERESGIGEKIEASIGVASTPPPIPEGFVIIE